MLRKFIEDNKHEEWFRPVAVLGILLIIAIGMGLFDEIKSRLTEPEETKIVESTDAEDDTDDDRDGNFLTDFLYENKTHLILIVGITAALGVIEHKKKADQKLKER